MISLFTLRHLPLYMCLSVCITAAGSLSVYAQNTPLASSSGGGLVKDSATGGLGGDSSDGGLKSDSGNPPRDDSGSSGSDAKAPAPWPYPNNPPSQNP